MKAWMSLVGTLLVLAGCASASLPYQPEPQPAGARISAGYQLVADRLRIEIDTDGRPLEEVRILTAEGAEVRAVAIDNPRVVAPGSPVGVGMGVGGGTYAGGSGVGVGSGLSIGFPIGGGSTTTGGHTIAWFGLDQAGPAPWRVYLKLAGLPPTVIRVGGPLTR